MRHIIALCKRRLCGQKKELCSTWKTTPNAITALGLAGIGAYCWLFVSNTATWIIPLLNIGIIFSDVLDGIVADRLDQHSLIGKFLDPLRDRLHTGALLLNVVLLDSNILNTPLFALLGAELLIGMLGMFSYNFFGEFGSVHLIGKMRAIVHWVSVMGILVQQYWLKVTVLPPATLVLIMMAASVCAALWYTHQAATRFVKRVPFSRTTTGYQ